MGSEENQIELDRIAEEFAAAIRGGAAPNIEDFVNRYPDPSGQLAELLSSVALIENLKAAAVPERPTSLATIDFNELQDYCIVREIGRGGMGVVFEAIHQSLDRRVALKFLASHLLTDSKQFARFRLEARAAARLRHPHIVPVFGVGSTTHQHYMVMDYIDGTSLRQQLSTDARQQSATLLARALTSTAPNTVVSSGGATNQPAHAATNAKLVDPVGEKPLLGTRQFHDWVAKQGATLCDALEYAHGQGVLHRDIKPGNLLIDRRGELWIVDFGLAKLAEHSHTATGEVIGTPQYMAPESFEGVYDVRSEVYCIGLTLFEMLVQRPAFEGKNTADIIRQAMAGVKQAPRQFNSLIPRDLETIVLKSLALEPDARYQTAGQLGNDLQRFLNGQPIAARRTRLLERIIRWTRREPVIASLTLSSFALLSALALVAVVGYASTQNALGVAQRAKIAAEASLKQKVEALATADEQRVRAEKNLQVALAAFANITENIATRGIEIDADVLGEVTDTTAMSVSPRDAELLQSLLAFFDQLAANNNEELLAESAIAAQRAAEIYVSLGRLHQAERAYNESRTRYQKLCALHPDQPTYLLSQAEVLNELSVIAGLRGELPLARELFIETRDLLQGSDAAMEMSAGVFQFARAHRLFASVGSRSGLERRMPPPAGAVIPKRANWMLRLKTEWDLDVIETAIGLLESLVEEAPTELRYRSELARAYRTKAEVAWRAKSRAEAETAVRNSIDLFEDLLSENRDSAAIRYELATTLLCTETLGFNQLTRAARADELCRSLLEISPTLPRYQALKARSLQNLARLAQKIENWDKADDYLREAEAIYASLRDNFNEVDAYATLYGQVIESIADLLVARGETDEAIEYLDRVLHSITPRMRNNLSPASAIQHQRLRTKLNKLREKS